MQHSLLISCVFLIVSCSEKTAVNYYSEQYSSKSEEKNKDLVINEFSPKGDLTNDAGQNADWIELFVSCTQPLKISANEWSLTDNLNSGDPFFLPDTILEPGSFLLIWCDKIENNSKTLHAPFKLASEGETIYLLRNGFVVDEISYDGNLVKKASYGRESDGSENWKKFSNPTPGFTNSLQYYAETL